MLQFISEHAMIWGKTACRNTHKTECNQLFFHIF